MAPKKMTFEEDCRLVERVLTKDWRAERELIDRYDATVLHVLFVYGVKNQLDFEEIKQDVFVAVFQHLRRWLEHNPEHFTLASYIWTITRNQARNFYRYWSTNKRNRTAVCSLDSLQAPQLISMESSPETTVMANITLQRLMRSGTQKQKQVVQLLVDGLSEVEIAKYLHVTRQMVNLYMHNIRRAAVELGLSPTAQKRGSRRTGCRI